MAIIAFIPVRGGSKSIPLKNIKPLAGKPLVCWSIEALESCDKVDKIIVATDSDEIWDVVNSKNYKKTTLYKRSDENASDTASTESVMLEYIRKAELSDDTIFMLVQATSPLTESYHFTEGIDEFLYGQYDSLLSCVRTRRFFWNDNGTSLNYDYFNRPRRQDFNGMLMENGAFYINTVGGILSSKNRLSGRIGIYEMPEYTSVEIDEPDDWAIMERLIYKYKSHHSLRPDIIKLFVSDIDGTLTDGGMYYSESGDEIKKFNTRDGMGFELLRNNGIKTALVTTEDTELNKRRSHKLKVDYLIQGEKNQGKLESVKHIADSLGISLNEVAYIGDDLNCVELLSSVGIAACPSDSCDIVKNIPGIKILFRKGGDGCVREFIDFLILR